MSEGILLPLLQKPILLPNGERLHRLREAYPQILAAIQGERDSVALQSTLACLLGQTLVQTNWCGFYRVVEPEILAVGPYQGNMGCLRIPFSRGVCGACARSGQIQRIPDVQRFSGHIACDASTRSELVLPVKDQEGRLRAVLDLDSPLLDAFSWEEAELLEQLLQDCFSLADLAW